MATADELKKQQDAFEKQKEADEAALKKREEELAAKERALAAKEKQSGSGMTASEMRDAVADGFTQSKSGTGKVKQVGMSEEMATDEEIKPSYQNLSDGVGEPITIDVTRMIAEANIIPPLCLVDDTFIRQHNRNYHSREFLRSNWQQKDLANTTKALTPFQSLDRLMDLVPLLIALNKLGNTVAELRCSSPTAKKFVKTDVQTFIILMLKHANGVGRDRVVREYVLNATQKWREGLISGVAVDKNRLSVWNDGLWRTALTSAGGRGEFDAQAKDEIEGRAPTPWGVSVQVATSGNYTKATEKVEKLVSESTRLGSAVLAGDLPDLLLPASLPFKFPDVSLEQRISQAGKAPSFSSSSGSSGGGGGGGSFRGGYRGGNGSSSGGNGGGGGIDLPKGGDDGEGDPKKDTPYSRSFRCFICADPDHEASKCPNLHGSVSREKSNDGKPLLLSARSYKPDGPKEFCFKGIRGDCKFQRTPEKCHRYHGCVLCGATDHFTQRCSLRKDASA